MSWIILLHTTKLLTGLRRTAPNLDACLLSTAKWASTNVESIFYSAATMTGFKVGRTACSGVVKVLSSQSGVLLTPVLLMTSQRLFNYIQGQNSQNRTIESENAQLARL